MVLILGSRHFGLEVMGTPAPHPADYSNTKELGRLLYTDYVYAFELAAVILLVAIVAAIALTLRRRKDSKYIDPAEQVKVKRNDRLRIVKMQAVKKPVEQKPEAGESGRMISLSHYLVLGGILFAISVLGIFLNRKNVIILLMAIELMLLAVNMNFIAFSHYLGDIHGQIFVFFILTVAAAESAIGLAILVVLFRNLHTINVDDLDQLKG